MNEQATPPTRVDPWNLADLFARAGVEPVGHAAVPPLPITSLVDDSRDVRPGACFVAVRGSHADGHDFVPSAVRAGATAIVVDRDVSLPRDTPLIRVADSRDALARLAAAYYRLRGHDATPMRLIGITGTNGKTTVAWMLRAILKAAGKTPALLGTIEYDLIAERCSAPLTTPGPLELCRLLDRSRRAGADWGVLEISSHALDQRRCDGLELTAAVFTNLSGDHLDYHDTMDRYAAAKRRLFDLLAADGVAVLNLDDPVGRSFAASVPHRVTTFALSGADADVRATVEHSDCRGTNVTLRGLERELPIDIRLVGRHNAANALAAAATAMAVGIGAEAIRKGLRRLRTIPGRLQRVDVHNRSLSVFVDYAHTDAALAGVLESLRPLTSGALRCVFGCGGDRDRGKRPRMAAVVQRLADAAYVTSDNPRGEDPRKIIDEILAGFSRDARPCRVVAEPDRRLAMLRAVADADAGDTILIAGKGHETHQLIGHKANPFDDAAEACRCLAARMAALGITTI